MRVERFDPILEKRILRNKEQQQQEDLLTKPNHKTGNKEEDYKFTSTSVLDTSVGHNMKALSSPVILSDQNNFLTTALSAVPSKTNVVVAHSTGGDLKEGEEWQDLSYTVKLCHGVFSCSCSA